MSGISQQRYKVPEILKYMNQSLANFMKEKISKGWRLPHPKKVRAGK